MALSKDIEAYFAEGCGRCPRGGTPDCSVHFWQEELQMLRSMLMESELTEERKWGSPCYTLNGKNVIMLGAFRDNCVISFLKGVLIADPKGILQKAGENSHIGRIIRFSAPEEVSAIEEDIKAFIQEAIRIEREGLEVPKAAHNEEIPAELQEKFDEMPQFENAFYALTPGRQRGYLIHFNQAKQSKTRTARIDKWMSKIFEGKGMHDWK